MDLFDKAFAEVIGLEGGYSDHRNDPGGRTMWGITERDHPWAWKDGPPTLEVAKGIYRAEYWDIPGFCRLASEAVAREAFEAGVNCGPVRSAKWLQMAYNGTRPDGWVDLVVDGVLGPRTAAAVNRMTRKAPEWERALLVAQNVFQGQHYLWLGQRDFIRGWLAKRVAF